jgi:hypothetical protein
MQDSAAEMTEVGRMQPTSLLATPEFSSSPTAGKGVGTATRPATFTGLNGDNPRDPSHATHLKWVEGGPFRRPGGVPYKLQVTPLKSILVGIRPPQAPKKPQSRAGWPGFLFMDPVRSIFFDQPTQNVKSCSSCLNSPSVSLLLCAAGSPARIAARPKEAKGGNSYITKARFSSSYCRTGRAHPAISTRPAASRAALGETP